MTHIYIDATARTAFDLGYKITLIRNAYATKDLKYNGKIVDEKYIQKSFLAALGDTFYMVKDI